MTRKLVFDTNIISYLINGHSFAKLYEKYCFGAVICISFMTEAELLRGAYKGNWGTRKLENLRRFIARCHVLHSDSKVVDTWAQIKNIPGKNISDADAWIAATALVYDLPLVSHNAKDFNFIPTLNLLTELSKEPGPVVPVNK
jgi:tRNA(fMet)-specific endonuclease VapC